MSRRHTPVERPRTVEAGRERIAEAASELLRLDDLAAFSLDAVARRAGVTRMTVYNQFGSRAGLLEEVFERMIARSAFAEMPSVFMERDNAVALDGFVAILGRFYTENRSVLLRLSAAAGADADLDRAMRARNERRRRAIETLVQRLADDMRPVIPEREVVNAVDVLLSFGMFNALAGPDRTPTDVVPLLRRMLRAMLGLAAAERAAPARGGAKPTARPRKRS